MAGSTYYGTFFGVVRTEWIPDHPRNMRLLNDVTFRDRHNVQWRAKEGDVIDGASTGWFFRRVFPAFVGGYRRATVLHDYYCSHRLRPSWQVHRMFYEAMRCDGTYPLTAWILWLAVRVFGPKW